jgi:glutamate carboxypeptidase
MNDDQRVLAYLRDQQASMTALLAQIVEMESPTVDKPSLDRLAAFLAGQMRDLGAEVETLRQEEAGNHVIGRWGDGPGGALLLCHMDTVWGLGTVAERPVRIEQGCLYGPGAYDMKGGIVNALWALRALQELGLDAGQRVSLLLTSDEEVGSSTSRPIIEAEALEHDVVFCLEPAQSPLGSLKTWRKGVGMYDLAVQGRSAHAGADHAQGVNAIEELAHQILSIQALTDYDAGTTVSVGVVEGGTRSNVVPERASAEIDVRVMDAAEQARIEAAMRGLRPHLDGAILEVTGGLNRPPMVRTPQIVALFTHAQSLAAGMGLEVSEAGTGGGSDGNFTAALGVPTLDGMGVIGDGAHAQHEYVLLSSLPERAALLAAMLRSMDAYLPAIGRK